MAQFKAQVVEMRTRPNRPKAYELIEKDISEKDENGQQTRDTFELSDFFVNHDHKDDIATREQLSRIFDLM